MTEPKAEPGATVWVVASGEPDGEIVSVFASHDDAKLYVQMQAPGEDLFIEAHQIANMYTAFDAED